MNQINKAMTDQNTIGLINRTGKDRRAKSGFNIRSLLFGGRREKIRRREDTRRIFFVDHYSPGLFFIIVSILFLCVIDALLTLRLLNQGPYEINPVMAYFLKFGPYTFFIAKYLVTIIPAIFLLMFGNIVLRIIKSTRSVLYAMAVFYLAVVVMQLYLVSNVASSPDFKLPPKMLTDTQIVCRMDTPIHHPVPTFRTNA
jgi:hypothetical protein